MNRSLYLPYLKWFIGLTCLILSAVATVNWVVDPYDIFGQQRTAGLNASKPAADTRVRVSKPLRVSAVRPGILILGNSRPEMGLDPSYACWPSNNLPIYNLAMPGAGLYLSLRNFQHALADGRIETLVLGLDFLFFLHDNAELDPYDWHGVDDGNEHLKVSEDGLPNGYFRLYQWQLKFKALFSLQAAMDAIRTFLSQGNPYAATVNRDGHNPGRQFLEIANQEGQEVLFLNKNREVAKLLGAPKVLFQGDRRNRWSRSFETLRRMLDIASSHGVRVILYINPRHADFLSLIDISGKWGLMEDWKREMTLLATRYGVELWDFHGFDRYSTPRPPARLGELLEGYWEPGHYRSALGNRIVDTIFGDLCRQGDASLASHRLRPDGIEHHLETLRGQLVDHAAQHAGSVDALKALFRKANSQAGT